MATLYHGTTLKNWERIQAEGFNGNSRDVVWTCSLFEVYFYDLDKHDCEHECIHDAFANAQLTAAAQNYMGETLVVIKVEVSDEHVEDDFSCENMSGIASVVDADNLSMDNVVEVYECHGYKPSLRLLVAAAAWGGEYFNNENFSDTEETVIEALVMGGIWSEELSTFEYNATVNPCPVMV